MATSPPWLWSVDDPPLDHGHECTPRCVDLRTGAFRGDIPWEVREAVMQFVGTNGGSQYVSADRLRLLEDLARHDITTTWPRAEVHDDQMCITTGASEAFCAVMAAIVDHALGNVVVAVPYYFNHVMWLKANGVEVRFADSQAPDGRLDVMSLAALMDDRTRAVVVVSPNNPTGAEYAIEDLELLRAAAEQKNAYLVVDQTYRFFGRLVHTPAGLHGPGWERNTISLFSFSKEFGMAGYRVGGFTAAAPLVRHARKWVDCATIAPSSVAVEAAVAALQECGAHRSFIAATCDRRLQTLRDGLRSSPWTVSSAGALFAWLTPRERSSGTDADLVIRLREQSGACTLPGSAFAPHNTGHVRASIGAMAEQDIEDLCGLLVAQ